MVSIPFCVCDAIYICSSVSNINVNGISMLPLLMRGDSGLLMRAQSTSSAQSGSTGSSCLEAEYAGASMDTRLGLGQEAGVEGGWPVC